MSRFILGIDPSGNFHEGKGVTGWCLLDTQTGKIAKFGYISAQMYKSQVEYWDAHITLIDSFTGYYPDVVVEDFLIYGNRANSLINSRIETAQLIGVIKYECTKRGIQVAVQTAQMVKRRWTDSTLVKKGYLKCKGKRYYIGTTVISEHIRDSVRHAVHYATFRKR